MKYVLDANAFIEPANLYYDLQVVPGYWKAIEQAHAQSLVLSIDRIRDELFAQKDDLAVWARTLPSSFFESSTDAQLVTKYTDVINWVWSHRTFNPAAKTEFAIGADGWLVAYSAVLGHTIVTQEVLKPDNTQRHVAIPNVCKQFGVQWINVYDLMRQLGTTLGIKLDC